MSQNTPHLAIGPDFAFVDAIVRLSNDYRAQVGDLISIEPSMLEPRPEQDDEMLATVTAVHGETYVVRATGDEQGYRTAEQEYRTTEEAYFSVRDSAAITGLWEEQLRKETPDGVAFADGLVPADLQQRLQAGVQRMIDHEPIDHHPGSGTRVRDLVHPSLYPFVRGKSITTSPLLRLKNPEYDRWGRLYEDSVYQWLPTPFRVGADGKVTVDSYINNLDRTRYASTYDDLAALFACALPLLESVLGYVGATEFWREGSDAEDESELPDPQENRAKGQPAPPRSLRGRELQVIPKIVEYRLGAGEDHEGVWHVEGMSHEHIVATCLFVLDRDEALHGGELRFKRSYTADEAGEVFWKISQIRPRPIEDLVEEGTIPVGSVATPKGRLVVFPNSHIHKLTPLTLAEGAAEGRRRVIVFWVVDPDVTIPSTREVPPQQGVFSREEALKIRLELMEERRRHKQSLNVRAISLCEH